MIESRVVTTEYRVCVKRYNFAAGLAWPSAAGQTHGIGNNGYLIKTAKNIRRV